MNLSIILKSLLIALPMLALGACSSNSANDNCDPMEPQTNTQEVDYIIENGD